MPTHGGDHMKKTRRHYDRESIVSELESGKPLAQIARKYGIHPSLPCRWRDELAENPEKAFSGNGNRCKYEARIAELERLLVRLQHLSFPVKAPASLRNLWAGF
jgi:transposase-like protein